MIVIIKMSVPLIQLPKPKVKGYATLSLYVGHSVFDEPTHMAGINHLLEHVLACNDDIDKSIAERGLEHNAETHGGYVRYWFSTPREHFEFCLKFLKKLSNKPEFKHVLREANAVRQELITLLEDTDYHIELAQIGTLFPDSSYLRGSNAQLMIDTLPKIAKPEILERYYKKNYVKNMFIVISGGPKVKGAQKLTEIPKTMTSSVPQMICSYLPVNKRIIHITRPEVEKSQCVLTFYNQPVLQQYKDNVKDTITLATRVLSGGLDSLLYRILRDKLQLVYSVSCEAEIEPYGVLIEITWSCDSKNVKRSVGAIFTVIKNFTALHFNGHRNLYLEQLVRQNVLTSEDIVDIYGDRLVTWGNYTPIETMISRVKKIKPSDVVTSVKTYMNPDRCFLVHASSKKKAPINSLQI